MLKQMKKKLKQQKGFTLVELLAVIAILGIIVAIAVPTIGNIIGNSENDALEANEELIVNAARLAHVSNMDFSQEISGASGDYYSVQDLAEKGFLSSVPDEVGNNGSYDNAYVTVSETTSGGVNYEYEGPTAD